MYFIDVLLFVMSKGMSNEVRSYHVCLTFEDTRKNAKSCGFVDDYFHSSLNGIFLCIFTVVFCTSASRTWISTNISISVSLFLLLWEITLACVNYIKMNCSYSWSTISIHRAPRPTHLVTYLPTNLLHCLPRHWRMLRHLDQSEHIYSS